MAEEETKEKIRELKELEKELVEAGSKFDDISNKITEKKDDIITSISKEETEED